MPDLTFSMGSKSFRKNLNGYIKQQLKTFKGKFVFPSYASLLSIANVTNAMTKKDSRNYSRNPIRFIRVFMMWRLYNIYNIKEIKIFSFVLSSSACY